MSCEKIKHDTEDDALRHVINLQCTGSPNARTNQHGLKAYLCDECKAWHVGHARINEEHRRWLDSLPVMFKCLPTERAYLICLHLFRQMQQEQP